MNLDISYSILAAAHMFLLNLNDQGYHQVILIVIFFQLNQQKLSMPQKIS